MLHYLTQLVGPQSISLLVFGMKGNTFFLFSEYANSQFTIWTSQICQIDTYDSLPLKLTNVNMTHTSTKYIKHNRNRERERERERGFLNWIVASLNFVVLSFILAFKFNNIYDYVVAGCERWWKDWGRWV